MSSIHKVTVLGTGVLGSQIAFQTSLGITVSALCAAPQSWQRRS